MKIIINDIGILNIKIILYIFKSISNGINNNTKKVKRIPIIDDIRIDMSICKALNLLKHIKSDSIY